MQRVSPAGVFAAVDAGVSAGFEVESESIWKMYEHHNSSVMWEAKGAPSESESESESSELSELSEVSASFPFGSAVFVVATVVGAGGGVGNFLVGFVSSSEESLESEESSLSEESSEESSSDALGY